MPGTQHRGDGTHKIDSFSSPAKKKIKQMDYLCIVKKHYVMYIATCGNSIQSEYME